MTDEIKTGNKPWGIAMIPHVNPPIISLNKYSLTLYSGNHFRIGKNDNNLSVNMLNIP